MRDVDQNVVELNWIVYEWARSVLARPDILIATPHFEEEEG